MKLRSTFAGLFCAALVCALFLWRSWLPNHVRADGVSGELIYQKHCAACHDQTLPRVPPRAALSKLPATRILRTLDFGVMMSVAYPLRREEREAVAKFLGTSGEEPGPPASAFCSDKKPSSSAVSSSDWNGWSPESSNTRFQTEERAGLNLEQVRNLKLK